ncbi:hypothetical protein AGOR_G00238140 [Albula goreensis]|uniref:Transferrin receptor protein 1 n=1 Tax=Albula goreensis TaxID=1534307 RepID=A0A8T3CCN7_9TELE|nr:hypothetical protein AGOR_G00238140 [Albula goreensis]
MNEARTTISKIFNGEPRSYTRFNLTQNMEGENSQVEMKLSSDVDEETGNGTGESNGYAHSRNAAAYVRKPQHSPRNVCFMVIATLLIFIIGYLIGYLAHRRQDKEPPIPATSSTEEESPAFVPMEEEPPLNWSDLKALLGQKLDENSMEEAFREFARGSHVAGSDEDRALGLLVMKRFKNYGLSPWNDEHFVKLQGPPSTGSNTVTFSGQEIGRPRAYLAYSATGTVEGRLIYAHYGRLEDFQTAVELGARVNGSVVLLRAGTISFAEKVANAAKLKASAVLIYPDPAEYSFETNAELFGHVHFGSGDPYTPGFPSFNHTQFPPAQSSGLPGIPAQTISASMATELFRKMGGNSAPSFWTGNLGVSYRLGGDDGVVKVEVNNVLAEKKINNVFGVLKGFMDPDRYVVIGAQRDAWGVGFAKSTVGTSLLVELARVMSEMVKNEKFIPRRSIIFASWSAGEYGSVGATEWLEGYLSSLNLKAFSYINLDGAVAGSETVKASASPLLYSLFQTTLKEVNSPTNPSSTLYAQIAGPNWEESVMVPMQMDDAAYPFLAFSGIPSISFRFTSRTGSYPYPGTLLDTRPKLNSATGQRTAKVAVAAAQVAGQMAMKLVHDHLLQLDVARYSSRIRKDVVQMNRLLYSLKQARLLPETLTMQWLMSALGSYSRASRALTSTIENTDLTDMEACRNLNDRIMRVERDFLSPYVSPKDTPFRHIFSGLGSHTTLALVDHLKGLKTQSPESDVDVFRNQFALATWTIQGCANALAGNVWELDNEI